MSEKQDFGAKPELAWLPIGKLSVEPKYQRDTGSTRSQNLIKKIVATFRWPRFGSILVVKIKGGGWHVIDGQHRVEAVRQLATTNKGFDHVPAIELPHSTVAEAAADFVAINRDRVIVTPLHIHHAMLAADEPTAVSVDRACKAAGMSIPRYQVPSKFLKPGQTIAVATIRRIVENMGEATATAILKRAVATFGTAPGVLNASAIRSSAMIIAPQRKNAGRLSPHSRDTSRPKSHANATTRKCLSCGHDFFSEGIGNRICPECKGDTGFREGAMAE